MQIIFLIGNMAHPGSAPQRGRIFALPSVSGKIRPFLRTFRKRVTFSMVIEADVDRSLPDAREFPFFSSLLFPFLGRYRAMLVLVTIVAHSRSFQKRTTIARVTSLC